jgi:hypothetical protein
MDYEIMFFAEKWMEVTIILSSKVSQAIKYKYCLFSLICIILTNDDDDDDDFTIIIIVK